MRRFLCLVAFGCATAAAEDHSHHLTQEGHDDAHIVVTINPEARVSAVLGSRTLSPRACESLAELTVRVINQGFVTAPLRATIVGGDEHVRLYMHDVKLSGAPEDTRTLYLAALGLYEVDVTIAFMIDDNTGDLGGRDRVHFVLRCVKENR